MNQIAQVPSTENSSCS